MIIIVAFISVTLSTCIQASDLLRSSDAFKSLIYNGQLVTSSDFFYQVSLETTDGKDHFCGGTIIDEYYILTAAHCVDGQEADSFQVRTQTFTKSKGGIASKVDKIAQHENYNPETMDNDIALIKLDQKLIFHSGFQPMLMPEEFEGDLVGASGTVSGWGLTETQDTPERMLSANIPILDKQVCKDALKDFDLNPDLINDQMLCAGDQENQNACQGDSGGGLIVDKKVVGVISWTPVFEGIPLCDTVTMYTRVSLYLDWIKDHMQSDGGQGGSTRHDSLPDTSNNDDDDYRPGKYNNYKSGSNKKFRSPKKTKKKTTFLSSLHSTSYANPFKTSAFKSTQYSAYMRPSFYPPLYIAPPYIDPLASYYNYPFVYFDQFPTYYPPQVSYYNPLATSSYFDAPPSTSRLSSPESDDDQLQTPAASSESYADSYDTSQQSSDDESPTSRVGVYIDLSKAPSQLPVFPSPSKSLIKPTISYGDTFSKTSSSKNSNFEKFSTKSFNEPSSMTSYNNNNNNQFSKTSYYDPYSKTLYFDPSSNTFYYDPSSENSNTNQPPMTSYHDSSYKPSSKTSPVIPSYYDASSKISNYDPMTQYYDSENSYHDTSSMTPYYNPPSKTSYKNPFSMTPYYDPYSKNSFYDTSSIQNYDPSSMTSYYDPSSRTSSYDSASSPDLPYKSSFLDLQKYSHYRPKKTPKKSKFPKETNVLSDV